MFSSLDPILVKSAGSFLFSLIFSLFGLKYLISHLKTRKSFQPIRAMGPAGHMMVKQKIPTMGGIVAGIALLLSAIFFCDLKDKYVVAVLVISLSFGLIGLIDDVMKVFYKNTNGFRGSIKLVLQLFICAAVLIWLGHSGTSLFNNPGTFIPFFRVPLYLGILYIPFMIFVIVGSSNAVNLTDGLDGLSIIPIILCASALGVIAYGGVVPGNKSR